MKTNIDPLVSAVIPTYNRPELVLRAVNSALNQNYSNLEVVVVIDGPDAATQKTLSRVSDHRLRVIVLPEKEGGCGARNAGVRAARGKWVAFLDDDDEWLPGKIAKQLVVAHNSKCQYPIVSCQVIHRTAGGDEIWPRKQPAPPLSEYLLARNSWRCGEGLVSTITILAPKDVFGHCEFTPGLKRYQEWDWLLRCAQLPGVAIEFVPEPLAIWNCDRNHFCDWEVSLKWLNDIKGRITRRSYAGFIATIVAPQASKQKAWGMFFPLLWDMGRNGSPKPIDYALYLGMWLPEEVRRRRAHFISAAFRRRLWRMARLDHGGDYRR
jgi:glycosyltransferase involved in cell wall biosynthesis